MKTICLFFCLLLFCTIPDTASCMNYTDEDIKNMGGKAVECVVEKVKVYNFHARLETGESLNILTNKETKFIPSNERLYKGDHIKVMLFEPIDASNSTHKSIAYSIEILKRTKREFIKSPKIGVYSLYKDRNGGAIYFKDIDKLMKFEKLGRSADSSGIKMQPGRKYEISFDIVAAKIGNGYVYVARNIKKVRGEKYSFVDTDDSIF